MAGIDVGTIIALIPTLLGLWIIVSIPVYLAARVVTGGVARFTQAMGATILGPAAYLAVITFSTAILGSIVGGIATLPAVILALLVWLWIYKASFKIGWLAAIGIAVLAIIVFIVASFVIVFAMGMLMPGTTPPMLPGTPLHQV
ncbi:MAG: hypothetical protein ACRD32_02400 [Nitrososphaerales archaeon]